MFELAKLAGYLLSPLTVAFCLGFGAALFAVARRRRTATALVIAAFVILWIGSMPALAQALTAHLESRYPMLSVQATPEADAIVVLGGALAGAHLPHRPHFQLGPAANRVWHAAALYRAGKAKWLVVAAGNQPGSEGQQIEADAIAEMLTVLGVPRAAIRLETRSRNTRENAANVLGILQALPARRVLLVTSAAHMHRAVKTATVSWFESTIEILPTPTDAARAHPGTISASDWFPSVGGLLSVTKGVKELAGMLALDII